MTATESLPETAPVSAAGNPIGFGRMLRKEDARFLRGKGNYIDDVQLPGMLHAAILRSPYAHARITSVDTAAAEAHPKVKAVITGQTLEGLKLAWMPTLSNDVQAVLATDKVRFQGQEVAFVVAEDRYAARDALELIDVEYEPLDPVVDVRTALAPDAPVAGLPEHKIRVIAPDIGGGFGNKVPIYPGYVCSIVASIVTGKPVKWMEDRTENLVSTGFARDYVMRGEIAATKDGKILGVRVNVIADHGAFNATAQPTKYPAGFFHVFTGSYHLEAAHCEVTGVYTNKAPGGVAYACSFRVTEAVYLIERMVDILAARLK